MSVKNSYYKVGKPVPKIDSPDKATGKSKYGFDIKLPGMLYGKILRSPLAHAKIKKIDASRAKKLRGVEAIITHKDVPRVAYNSAPLSTLEPRDKFVLDAKVRFVGDDVAAVAAADKDTAEAALELIDVEYEELPAVFDPMEAMESDAPRIHDARRNICALITREWGDLGKGFKKADYIFEDEYKTHAVHACPMEPHACLASYESGLLRIWSGLQAPHPFRYKIAQIFGIPQSKVRITTPYIGGGFGNKDALTIEPITISLTMKTNKPVKLELTREEVFFTSKRAPSIVELKTGVIRDGTLTARQVSGILVAGAYASHGPNVAGTFAAGSVGLVSLYKTPSFSAKPRVVYTNTPPSGAVRGYGNPQGAFPLESQMDQIATELNIDPIELRLKNCIRAGDVDPATDARINSCGIDDCVDKIKKEMRWEEKRNYKRKIAGKKKTGFGLAFLMHVSGAAPPLDQTCSAIVKINADGTVNILSASVDIGQGSNTTLTQIASEELKVPMSQIKITEEADTIFPYDRGCYASGTLYLTGEAVRRAAADAKNKLLKEASKKLKKKMEKLWLENGDIIIRGKQKKRIPMTDVIKDMPGREIIGIASYNPSFNAPNFGVQSVEVEVDTETGELSVLKLAYAHDIGKAINSMIVEGQLEGGMVQGLGYALTENLVLDGKTGRYFNPNFSDYRIAHAGDYPKIKALIVESNEDTGPFSGKGCGEASIVPTAPAVANAIFNAIGIRFKEIPITPEIILKALRKK